MATELMDAAQQVSIRQRGGAGVREPFEMRRIPLSKVLHIRSAGRGAELGELDQSIGSALHQPCPSAVGGFVEIDEPAAAAGGGRLIALRTRPSELVMLSLPAAASRDGKPLRSAAMEQLVQAMEGRPLLAAVEATDGMAAFGLAGEQAGQVLLRLADATSLPAIPGTAARLRFADLPASLIWRSSGQFLLLVDALYADILAQRITYAFEGIGT